MPSHQGSKIGTVEHRLERGRFEVAIATALGPRITRFAMDGRNAFADLGDLSIPHPDGRPYRLIGGHRLWVAPEEPATTYEPDDNPVSVHVTDDDVAVTQPAGPAAGIEKTVRVGFVGESVAVQHILVNRRAEAVRIAPWAITQLPVGGTAVLPLPRRLADTEGLQPNAEIVLWPYAGIADTPFELRERLVLLTANRSEATKIGVGLDRKWLAYIRDGLVFVKRAIAVEGADYLDRGAAAQCYCSADFVELETLGPVTKLHPGESITHDETWQLFEVDSATDPSELPLLLNLDGGVTL